MAPGPMTTAEKRMAPASAPALPLAGDGTGTRGPRAVGGW